jgi:hypothetical protein
MLHRAAVFAGILSLGAASLLAQVPAEERIPITDPERLEKMGFPRDARNVYVWSRADLDSRGPKRGAAAPSMQTWGSSAGYSDIAAYELQAYSEPSDAFYRADDLAFLWSTSHGGPSHAHARIQAPEGASLGEFRFWANDDSSPDDLFFYVYETCQEYGYGDPIYTLLAQSQTAGNYGDAQGSVSLNGATVNNRDCGYSVQVVFPPVVDTGASMYLRKVQTSWTRQVSPAPATATFVDVPVGHPYFQFVEALAKSGITGGCDGSPPLYCPDAPLTRGQMAVFLAKALGLQWP